MAQRILKNNTASSVPISDTGGTVPASGQLVINPDDYGVYEGSNDVVTLIGNSTLTVNDGTFDLSITEGTRLMQGGFSRPISDGDDPTIKAGVRSGEAQSDYNKRFLTESILAGLTKSNTLERVGVAQNALKVLPINEVTVNISNQNTDLFDRLSVAEDVPLWSYSHRYNDDIDLYWDKKLTGTGNSFSHDSDKVVQILSNGTASANETKYRTFRYFEYSKGRMQSFLCTVNPKSAVANVTKLWGCFDDKNGLFFKLNGTTPELVIRSSTSGSTTETVFARTSWDDKMDGTGASGINIDFDKLNLYYIQFAWLGGNAVEWGIFQDGQKLGIHRAKLSNISATSYSQSGNLPFSFEIKNNDSVGTAPTMEVNCLAVFNNGRQDELGDVFGVDTGTTEKTINTTESIIAAIRMQSTMNEASLRALNFNLVSPSGNSSIYYKVEIQGTFTGDSWNTVPNSIAEGINTFSTYTNGFMIQSGYVQAGESVQVEKILSNLYLGRDIDGNSQVLALTAQTVNSTAKILFSGRFREYK